MVAGDSGSEVGCIITSPLTSNCYNVTIRFLFIREWTSTSIDRFPSHFLREMGGDRPLMPDAFKDFDRICRNF